MYRQKQNEEKAGFQACFSSFILIKVRGTQKIYMAINALSEAPKTVRG